MFTGLVEEMGEVLSLEDSRLTVAARVIVPDAGEGASVAVNGVCLTVVVRGARQVGFDIGPETRARTALGDLRHGDRVNLERPLRLGGQGVLLVLFGLLLCHQRPAETYRPRRKWESMRRFQKIFRVIAITGSFTLTKGKLN